MKTLFHRLTAPLRWLWSRPQVVYDFFTTVPEDVSLGETLGAALESRAAFRATLAGFGEHLQALRRHIFRSLLVLAATTAAGFYLADGFMHWLAAPLGGVERLYVIEPTESVGTFMHVAVIIGIALAMPWILGEAYLFVAPGLMPPTRVRLLAIIPVGSALFAAGVGFTALILPAAVGFLQSFGHFQNAWRASIYFKLVSGAMLWMGLAFQLPLIVYVLAALGLVRAQHLLAHRRLAIIATAIIAAAATPSTDPVNMLILWAPLAGLYFVSIAAAAVARPRRQA